ncbi:MAG TPA: hypothetical protein PKZ15_05590 [Paludibacteraceae bacterium]|nr:hypothetical protein [Paludibacteraceae bacterium]
MKRYSAFVRYLIAFLALLFLTYLIWSKDFSQCVGMLSFSFADYYSFLFPVFFLVPVNWLLEAVRWRILLSKVQTLSLKDASLSVLMGLSTAIMTPAQLGEFAGRLILVSSSCRKKAAFLWSLGGIMLTVAILLWGLPAVAYYVHHWLVLDALFEKKWTYAILLGILFLVVFVLLLGVSRFYEQKIQKVKDLLSTISLKDMLNLILLSMLRCFVFSFQLVLMLKFYGLSESWLVMFVCVCVSYLIITFIPSFFFSDAVVRSSVAVLVFSPFADSSLVVVSASISLWILNVAIPTFVGALLVLFYSKKDC